MKYYPPFLDLVFTLRARRPGGRKNKSMVKTYWTHRFTIDTVNIDLRRVIRRLFDLFGHKPDKELRQIYTDAERGLARAEEEIPSESKIRATEVRNKILENYRRESSLSKKEVGLLGEVANRKSFLLSDLLALPPTYQRMFISYYLGNEKKKAESWLYRRGFRAKRYTRGVPSSLFVQPIIPVGKGSVRFRRGGA